VTAQTEGAPRRGPGRPRLTTDETSVLVTPRFAGEWHADGYPWCDQCGMPAVRVPGSTWLHAAPGHRGGVPREFDTTGHRVTANDWWDLVVNGPGHSDPRDAA
jgi:hypothetical protein